MLNFFANFKHGNWTETESHIKILGFCKIIGKLTAGEKKKAGNSGWALENVKYICFRFDLCGVYCSVCCLADSKKKSFFFSIWIKCKLIERSLQKWNKFFYLSMIYSLFFYFSLTWPLLFSHKSEWKLFWIIVEEIFEKQHTVKWKCISLLIKKCKCKNFIFGFDWRVRLPHRHFHETSLVLIVSVSVLLCAQNQLHHNCSDLAQIVASWLTK